MHCQRCKPCQNSAHCSGRRGWRHVIQTPSVCQSKCRICGNFLINSGLYTALCGSIATTNSCALGREEGCLPLQYRTLKDLRTAEYLAPRAADKFIFSLIVMSLYWKVGKRMESSQVNNQVSVLFMWAVLPGTACPSFWQLYIYMCVCVCVCVCMSICKVDSRHQH